MCDEQVMSPWLMRDEEHADQMRLKEQPSQMAVAVQCHQIHGERNPLLHQKVWWEASPSQD